MLERQPRNKTDFQPLDWRRSDRDDIMARIAAAGLIGMGGAGFPVVAKLRSGIQYAASTIIANGVECEPGVNADRALLRHYLPDVLEGLRIAGACLAKPALILAVSDQSIYQAFVDKGELGITCRLVADAPSNGEERTLIGSLFSDEIPTTRYPSQCGYIVFNVATLFAICEAVRDGSRPRDRLVTLFGEETWVELDTKLGDIGQTGATLRLGSTATGRMASNDDVVSLTTNAVEHGIDDQQRACIHCGWCDAVCPRHLPVEAMLRQIQSATRPITLSSEVNACFECGACVVQCPSAIPLLDLLRSAKREVENERRKQVADLRFQQHTVRAAETIKQESITRSTRIETRRQW
ncbi:MAG: 4Fe-4S dicluster domain-containing protein [Gammaproteobacteria bacterium]|nr:4Fe-4S dicluster domain-containing protein [Gammaproteobacteria bacterium]